MRQKVIFISDSKNSNSSQEFQSNSKNSNQTMEIKTIKSYQKEILAKYKREKGGELSIYLLKPTPKLIKESCLLLLNKRNLKHDAHVLNCFFQFKSEDNRFKEIQKFDADKFRPIEYLLKGKSRKTSIENLELLSWLIDFQPRPYEVYIKSDTSLSQEPLNNEKVKEGIVEDGQEKSRIEEIEKKQQEEEERKKQEEEKRKLEEIRRKEEEETNKQEEIKKKKRRKLVITISIAFGAILATGIIFKNQIFPDNSNNPPPNNEKIDNPVNANIDTHLVNNKCMTWADSLYVSVSCDKGPFSIYGTKVDTLDQMKLKKMKKVEVDAAYKFFSDTEEPLIWYYKKSNREFEYFTAPGLHPTNGETLKKITPYIIQTYVPVHTTKKSSFVP